MSPTTSSDRGYRLEVPRSHSPQHVRSSSSSPSSIKRPRSPSVMSPSAQLSPDLYDELEEDVESPPRKKKWKAPTGHRRGLSVTEMVPLDAPTRPRRRPYNDAPPIPVIHSAAHGASGATSPMSVSSAISADSPLGSPIQQPPRASMLHSIEDDSSEDELAADTEEGNDLTHPSTAAEKRRQNTIAARRSRQRKLQYVRDLESRVQSLAAERDTLLAKIEKLEERNEIFKELLTGSAKPIRPGEQGDPADVKMT
jgi:Basic region leucine zipper